MANLLSRLLEKRERLQTQLTALFLIVSIVPLLWVSYFAYSGGRKALQKSIGLSLARLAMESVDKVDMSLFWRIQQVQTAASNAESIIDALETLPIEERKRAWMEKQPISQKAIEIVNVLAILAGEDGKVVLTDRNGRILHANQWVLDFDQSSERWWKKAYNNGLGHTYIGQVKYDTNVNVHSIDMAVPVMDRETNRALGVLEVTFILSDLRDMVWRLNRLGEGMETYIIDEEGKIVAAPPGKDVRILQDRLLFLEAAMLAIQASPGDHDYMTEPSETGERLVIGWAHSAGYMGYKLNDWSVLVLQPTKLAFATASDLRNQIWLLAGISAVITAIVGFIFTRQITRPVIRLADAARAIGQGTFEEIEIPITSKNEVGVLVTEFNLMRRNLRELMGQLADEKEKMKSVINSIAEGLVFLDRQGRIVHINPTAQQLLKIDVDMIGTDIHSALTNPTLKRLFESCQLSTHQRKTITQEIRMEHGRKEITLKALASPVISEDDILLGTVYVFEDITREKEIDRMKSDFVSLVSHELRTPMTTIQLGISLILDEKVGKINEKQRTSLEKVDRQAKRLTRLINDLLDLSRIESGRVQMKHEPISILDIVVSRLEEIKPQTDEKGIDLDLEVVGDIPLTMGDGERIGQVITNLVSNAVKFTPSGGRILVRLTRKEKMILTEVIDSGPGIPPEERDKVFDKFYQLSDVNTRQQGGSGLGLSIAKEIIEAHNGRIWVESQEGKGSQFKFLLPLIVPKESG